MQPWKSPRSQNGFSLIEVIASLMLVGTLLVAVLTAHRRNLQQTIRAEKRLAAVTALDALMTERMSPSSEKNDDLPEYQIAGYPDFLWRSHDRYDAAAESLGAVVLRIEVYDPNYKEGQSLAWVELLTSGTRGAGGNRQP